MYSGSSVWHGLMFLVMLALQACGGESKSDTTVVLAPTASLAGSDMSGIAGQPVRFRLADSAAREGRLCAYHFRSGDGQEWRESGCGEDNQPVAMAPVITVYPAPGTYTAWLTVRDSQGLESTATWLVMVEEPIPAGANDRLNDTGATACWNEDSLLGECTAVRQGVWASLGQDGRVGRDALSARGLLLKAGGGNGGFDFSKIGSAGERLPPSAAGWRCVLDHHTGLMWEVKTADGGLHDLNRTFAWYDTNPATNGHFEGYENEGRNTREFVRSVNEEGLCGYKDWRLPTRHELVGLVNYGVPYPGPTIDQTFFPHTPNGMHWTASAFPNNKDHAWVVDFISGETHRNNSKSFNGFVRAVRWHEPGTVARGALP